MMGKALSDKLSCMQTGLVGDVKLHVLYSYRVKLVFFFCFCILHIFVCLFLYLHNWKIFFQVEGCCHLGSYITLPVVELQFLSVCNRINMVTDSKAYLNCKWDK